jgi:hypothetical protein
LFGFRLVLLAGQVQRPPVMMQPGLGGIDFRLPLGKLLAELVKPILLLPDLLGQCLLLAGGLLVEFRPLCLPFAQFFFEGFEGLSLSGELFGSLADFFAGPEGFAAVVGQLVGEFLNAAIQLRFHAAKPLLLRVEKLPDPRALKTERLLELLGPIVGSRR